MYIFYNLLYYYYYIQYFYSNTRNIYSARACVYREKEAVYEMDRYVEAITSWNTMLRVFIAHLYLYYDYCSASIRILFNWNYFSFQKGKAIEN